MDENSRLLAVDLRFAANTNPHLLPDPRHFLD